MLHIFLCEDNEKQRLFFADIIEKVILIEDFDLSFACATANPYEILQVMENTNGTGIYFLDIDLQCDMDGLSLAQQIRKKDPRGFIVFVTTHSEMSYMTFTYKVEAMDFIIKDKPQELQNRIHQCILDAYHKYSSPKNNIQKTFTCTAGDKEHCIPLDEILFFETAENAHKILLHTANKIVEFSGKMKELEKTVDERFYRVHRSFLLNKDHIQEINHKERVVIMNNQDVCLASARQLKGLKK